MRKNLLKSVALVLTILFFLTLLISCDSKKEKLVGEWITYIDENNDFWDSEYWEETRYVFESDNCVDEHTNYHYEYIDEDGKDIFSAVFQSYIKGEWNVSGEVLCITYDLNTFSLELVEQFISDELMADDEDLKELMEEEANLLENVKEYYETEGCFEVLKLENNLMELQAKDGVVKLKKIN